MTISGNGKPTELFSTDTRFRLYDIQKLSKWYNRMAYLNVSLELADRFLKDLKKPKKADKIPKIMRVSDTKDEPFELIDAG